MLVTDFIMVKNILPVPLCERVVKQSQQNNWRLHAWANNYKPVDEKLEPTVSKMGRMQAMLIQPYIDKMIQEYQDMVGSNFISNSTHPRLNRYKEGSIMASHNDHINIHELVDGSRGGNPLLSMVGNLNNEYTGSDFMIKSEIIPLTAGDVVLFPSNFMYPHQVTECLRGIRYSFVQWFY